MLGAGLLRLGLELQMLLKLKAEASLHESLGVLVGNWGMCYRDDKKGLLIIVRDQWIIGTTLRDCGLL